MAIGKRKKRALGNTIKLYVKQKWQYIQTTPENVQYPTGCIALYIVYYYT